MKFLLDTNILSEPLKPKPSSKVLRKLRLHQSEITTAAPVWHELLYGYGRMPPSVKREALGRYLRTVIWPEVPILPYESEAAEWHAAERARLTQIGRSPSFVDGQIAAVAATNNLILVTANVADFSAFQNLRLETWL